jgi:hypothetical protein
MLHMHLPSDARIVDEVFSLTGTPKCRDEGWLMAMVSTYGKTTRELKEFTWNDDDSISIPSKKRPVRPLHPQWVYLFQLKEKQPSKLKSRWSSLAKSLEKKQKDGLVNLSLDSLLLAYKIRKVYYTPLKQSERSLVAA